MMDWLLLAIGAAGFGLAGYWDLKTTEFPDWLPYAVIVLSLVVRGAYSWMLGDWWIILNSVIVGGLFLGLGLLLYYIKQWGDGDAWLLGALGFLFPVAPGSFVPVVSSSFLFQMALLFNFFVLSFVYLIVYAIGMGVKDRRLLSGFSHSFSGQAPMVGMMTIMFSAACLAIVMVMSVVFGLPVNAVSHILLLPAAILGLLVFVQYGQYIEKHMFKREISVKDLRVGDVPVGEKFRVLNQKEVDELKAKGGKVWIKEGVRLSPVFLITLLVTFFYGSLLLV